jgi:hypothetical protein
MREFDARAFAARLKRERWGILALVAAAALYAWAMARHLNDVAHHHEGLDFQDYYYSTKAVLRGKSIYDHQAMLALARADIGTTGLPAYVYPPLLTVLFVPLTRLPYATAWVAWLALDQLLLVAAVVACARICAERGARAPGALFCATFVLLGASAFEPTLDHDWQGQSNTLVLALSAWALYQHLQRTPSDWKTGALLAPAVLLKLFPGIFLPYLVLRRRWGAALWTGAVSVGVTALSLAAVPWADYVRLPSVLANSIYLNEGGATLFNYSMPVGVWWVGFDGPRWAGIRDALVETKRLGILLLGVATEAYIWRLKRPGPQRAKDRTRAAALPADILV